jgi:hypothetical protein
MRSSTLLTVAFAATLTLITTAPNTILPPTPTGSRCIDVKPVCPPGTEPICLCESDISLNCKWICASPGAR